MVAIRKSWLFSLVLATLTGMAGTADAWPGHFGHGHRGYGWPGNYSWGGYGNWGYPSVSYFRPRLGFGFAPYRSYYSSYSFGLPSYSVGYSVGYPAYRASYFAPVWNGCFFPRRVVTYSLPTCYVAPPVYSYPAYNVSSYYSYPVCTTDAADSILSSAPLASSSTGAAPVSWSANESLLTRLAAAYPSGSSYRSGAAGISDPAFAEAVRVAGVVKGRRGEERATIAERSATIQRSAIEERSVAVRLVSAGANEAHAIVVPRELLEAADAIFARGGYRDAALAYARLSVRYGVNDELATRRFVALIASGDCEQAAVVTESSAAANVRISAVQLPGGALAELYASQADKIVMHGDSLAKYALSQPDQALPLIMVGTWLTLDGQADRGRVFFDRAAQMSDVPEIDGSQLFASTRVAR